MKKVLIGIATRGNDMYYKLCGWLLQQKESNISHIDVIFAVCHTGASFAQNTIFKAMSEKNYDYLFMVDSDVCPPDDIIEQLIAHDKDIIKAPVWHFDPLRSEIHVDITKEGDAIRRYNCPTGGVEEIFTSSFSCLLLKKKVLDRFIQEGEDFTLWSPIVPPQYKGLQSDTIFFAKARAFGFTSWVDWSVRGTVHHRIVSLSNDTLDTYMVNRVLEAEVHNG